MDSVHTFLATMGAIQVCLGLAVLYGRKGRGGYRANRSVGPSRVIPPPGGSAVQPLRVKPWGRDPNRPDFTGSPYQNEALDG